MSNVNKLNKKESHTTGGNFFRSQLHFRCTWGR
jgi:hypothetical protein